MGGAVQGPLVLRTTPPLNAHVLFLQVLGIKVETKVQCGALSLLCSLLCPALSTSGAWGWGLGAGNHPDPKPTSAGRTRSMGFFPIGVVYFFLWGGVVLCEARSWSWRSRFPTGGGLRVYRYVLLDQKGRNLAALRGRKGTVGANDGCRDRCCVV